MANDMTPRERAEKGYTFSPEERASMFIEWCALHKFGLQGWPDNAHKQIAAHIKIASEDAAATERARLAQSGSVEELGKELLHALDYEEHLLRPRIEDDDYWRAWAKDWRRVARLVQTKLNATAEAARIEARDAIANFIDSRGFDDGDAIRALRPDELTEEKKP